MDPMGETQCDDLAAEEVVPVAHGQVWPMQGRPYQLFPDMTDAEMAGMRSRATPASCLAVITDAVWVFADTA